MRLLALLLALTLLSAACTSAQSGGSAGDSSPVSTESSDDSGSEAESSDGDDSADSEPGLVWIETTEPPDLHAHDPDNNLTVTAWIRQPLLEGLYGVSGALDFFPELLAEDGEVVANEDGSVTINMVLRDGLLWSNGEPLTTADVAYTWDIWKEGCDLEVDGTIGDGSGCSYLASDRAGLDLISGITVRSATEMSITFVRFFAGWRGLFNELYHPSFGADADAVNESLRAWGNGDGPLVSSGPMVFGGWEDDSLTLLRNDAYHGSVSPDAQNGGLASVDRVTVSFVEDADAQIEAIEAGDAHVIMTGLSLELGERLASQANVTIASTAGPTFEHWGLNLLNPHLAKPEVREAIAYGLDKSEIVSVLYAPIFGELLAPDGLGNTFWMTDQAAYEDHQAKYAGKNVAAAKIALEAAGYSTGSGGVFTHPSDGRLTLRVGTTGGNELRELQLELAQAQLAESGIELEIDNVEGGDFYTQRPFAEDALDASASGGAEGDSTIWDIAQFPWVGGPWPGAQVASYITGNDNNPYGFRNADFDALASECGLTVEDEARAACYNTLDRFVTTLDQGDDGLFVIPLTQSPSVFGYVDSRLVQVGVAPDVDEGGPLANVVDFQFAE